MKTKHIDEKLAKHEGSRFSTMRSPIGYSACIWAKDGSLLMARDGKTVKSATERLNLVISEGANQ